MSAVHVKYLVPPGVVLVRLSGRVSISKMVTLLEAVRQHPPGKPILADCRELARPTAAAIAEVARRLTPPSPYDPAAQLVILVSPDLSTLGPTVEHLFPGPRTYPVHVCLSWQDAVESLGVSAEDWPDDLSGSRR